MPGALITSTFQIAHERIETDLQNSGIMVVKHFLDKEESKAVVCAVELDASCNSYRYLYLSVSNACKIKYRGW